MTQAKRTIVSIWMIVALLCGSLLSLFSLPEKVEAAEDNEIQWRVADELFNISFYIDEEHTLWIKRTDDSIDHCMWPFGDWDLTTNLDSDEVQSVKGIRVYGDDVIQMSEIHNVSFDNIEFFDGTNMDITEDVKSDPHYKIPHFSNYKNLKSVVMPSIRLDDVNYDVYMDDIFNGCENLEEVDFSNVTKTEASSNYSVYFRRCFYNCSSLKNLDLSSIVNPPGVITYYENWLYGCSSLETLDVSGFNSCYITVQTNEYRPSLKRIKTKQGAERVQFCNAYDPMFFRWKNLNTGYVQNDYYGTYNNSTFELGGYWNPIDTNEQYGWWEVSMRIIVVKDEEKKTISYYNSVLGNIYADYPDFNKNWDRWSTPSVYYADMWNHSDSFKLSAPWMYSAGIGDIETIVIRDTIQPTSINYWFRGWYASNLKTLDIQKLDASEIISAKYAFSSLSLNGETTKVLWPKDTKATKIKDLTNCFADSYFNLMDFSWIEPQDETDLILSGYSTVGCNEFIISDNNPFTYNQNSSIGGLYHASYINESYISGSWIREDGLGPFTGDELNELYLEDKETFQGHYLRAPQPNTKTIKLDGNGGYPDARYYTVDEGGYIILPTAQRARDEFLGWSADKISTDVIYGSDTQFSPDSSVTVLYAQWASDIKIKYIVEHYQESANNLDSYNLADEFYYYIDEPQEVTPTVNGYQGFVSPEEQTVLVNADGSTIIKYYYDRIKYNIRFDGNGETSGQMSNQQMIGGISDNLSANTFHKKGSLFTGWNTSPDGSGTSYVDEEEVVNLSLTDGGIVTLYAQWLNNDNKIEPTNGVIYVTCGPGETIVIPDLPYGTTYTVEEVDLPIGWTQAGITNDTGLIPANQTATATATNRYEATGEAVIVAHKRLIGDTVQAGQFTFELLRNGTVIDTKTNGEIDTAEEIAGANDENIDNPWVNAAPVTFDAISYTAADIGKSYTYTIREVKDYDDKIIYDGHTETVTVAVFDQGDGVLGTTVTYDNDGALFSNEMLPGTLKLSKLTQNTTAAADETEHEFTVLLKDAAGNDLEGDYTYTKYVPDTRPVYLIDDTTQTAYSYTQNFSEDGTKNSDYGNYWTNSHIRGTGRETASSQAHVITLPGAESLHVTISYGGESTSYDWACIWAGNYPSYTAVSNYGSSISGRLGGTFGTREYDIPGDTVTFAFKSDGSGVGSGAAQGYGYYAVITGVVQNKIETGETEPYLREESGALGTDRKLTLKGGESVTINSLPHGATYEIVETEQPGWTLTSAEGDAGTITAGQTVESAFTNTYSTHGEVALTANKTFIGGEIADEQFAFELVDTDGVVLDTADVLADGTAQFAPIIYEADDDGNTYTYYIREVKGTDEKINYDEHVEEVTVRVTDNGQGEMTTDVTVDEDGPAFTNINTADLSLHKTVAGNIGNKEGSFPFTVTLGTGGTMLPGTYTYTVAGEKHTFIAENTGEVALSIELSHDETAIFTRLPVGVKYTITEEAPSYTIEMTNDGIGTLTEDTTIEAVNTMDGAIPTKVHLHGAIIGLLIVIVAIAMTIFVVIQKKRRQ